MKEDIRLYFAQTVISHYNKYVEEKFNGIAGLNTDLDSAIISAGILYHFRERLPGSWGLTAKYLNSVSSDYTLLGDIVNATKHNSLDASRPQYKNRKPLINSADDISQVVLLIEYEDEKGLYYDHEKCVFVKLNNGSNCDIYEVLTAVVNLWIKELNQINVLDNMAPVALKTKGIPTRLNDAGTGNFGLSFMARMPMRGVFQMMKYNYQTGKLDPEDMTGRDFKLEFFKMPKDNLDITVTSDTGYIIQKKMKISREDSDHLMSLETTIEQQALLIALVRKEGVINEVNEELIKLKNSLHDGS